MLVFLSHNKLDKQAAKEIALFLVAENVNVWFDEWEIAAGDSIVSEIEKGLAGCTHFVVIWSKNSKKSVWVRRELESALTTAIQTGTPLVIPIILDDTPPPRLLASLRYIRFRRGREKARSEIVESICLHKPSVDFIKAIVKKYHEVITGTVSEDDPFGLVACPECGSQRLKRSEFMDYARDEKYYLIDCEDCGWLSSTQ